MNLIEAIRNGQIEVLRTLIENGADIKALNNLPIQLASEYGHVEVVKMLIENGVLNDLEIPIIENIHEKVAQAVSESNFDMGNWHSECGTTHCWAGWVVHLAGEKGYELEEALNTPVAAKVIYLFSDPDFNLAELDFYGENKETLEKIKKFAKTKNNE